MKEKILDKQVLRYVIATTVSGKPTYLKKKLQKIEYSFVTDIDDATKCSSYAIAEAVRKYYEHDTRDTNAGLIIIPVVISYVQYWTIFGAISVAGGLTEAGICCIISNCKGNGFTVGGRASRGKGFGPITSLWH